MSFLRNRAEAYCATVSPRTNDQHAITTLYNKWLSMLPVARKRQSHILDSSHFWFRMVLETSLQINTGLGYTEVRLSFWASHTNLTPSFQGQECLESVTVYGGRARDREASRALCTHLQPTPPSTTVPLKQNTSDYMLAANLFLWNSNSASAQQGKCLLSLAFRELRSAENRKSSPKHQENSRIKY